MNKTKVLLTLSLSLFLLFLLFSYFVWTHPVWGFDMAFTNFSQQLVPRSLDLPFSVVSVLGAPELTGTVIFLIAGIFWLKRKYLIALGILVIIPATLIEILIKHFLYHPGVPVSFSRNVLNFVPPSSSIQTDFGFPTGRVLRTTFLLIVLFALSNKVIKNKGVRVVAQVLLVIFFLLLVTSRIYLGEHWFSDVLAAILLGASAGILAILPL